MPRQSIKRSRKSALKRWKTFNEKELLESYFKLDNSWSRKTITYVKNLVKLSEEQIYKWGYEKKRKLRINSGSLNHCESVQKLPINEAYLFNKLDYNNIVNELFPEREFEDEKLSPQELQLYDSLKDKMMVKDAKIKEMNELDQILYERLPTSEGNLKKPQIRSRKTSTDDNCSDFDTDCKEEESRKLTEEKVGLKENLPSQEVKKSRTLINLSLITDGNREPANEPEILFFDFQPTDNKMDSFKIEEKEEDFSFSFSEENPFELLRM